MGPANPFRVAGLRALLLGLALGLSSCARANLPGVPLPAKPILEITFWMNDRIDPKWFYFIAIELDNDPATGPLPEVSGTSRALNWSDFLLYTDDARLTSGAPTFLYKKIAPENDQTSILQVPDRFDRQPFFLAADIQSRNVLLQPRTSNAIHFQIDRDEFTKITGGGNFNRLDIQFIVASAGVDQITNPPTPPEVSHTLDALDVTYLSIPSLSLGTVYNSDFTPNERVGDAPIAAVDIAGWEIKVR